MTFYTDLAADAVSLLAEFGQAGTIQKPTPTASGGGPTDATGGTPGTTPDPVAAQLVVFPVSEDRINGTNIFAGDWQVIVEPVAGGIDSDDLVICDKGTLRIAMLGEISPAGTVVAYDMVCRG